ncbi:MAG: hypothetical protein KF817_08420 [Phycisphaeraceae bacterium]|nr:hypothetical protein [Phycisphaeraceae bacterium]
MMSPGRTRRFMRMTCVVVLGLAALYVAREIVLLVTGPAPFHQVYSRATDAQNAEVTRRLCLMLFAAPFVLAAIPWAAFPGRFLRHASRTIGLVAVCLLSGGLTGWVVLLFLPYGAGSSYEHASSEQRLHLDICRMGGAVFVVAGVLLVGAGLALRKPGTTTTERT